MSSILDALNKLEHEKSRSSRPGAAVLESRAGVQDILPEKPPGGRRVTLEIGSVHLILGGIGVLIVVAGIALGSMLVANNAEQSDDVGNADVARAAGPEGLPSSSTAPGQMVAPAPSDGRSVGAAVATSQPPNVPASTAEPPTPRPAAVAPLSGESDSVAEPSARRDTTTLDDGSEQGSQAPPPKRTETAFESEAARAADSAFDLAKSGELSPSPRSALPTTRPNAAENHGGATGIESSSRADRYDRELARDSMRQTPSSESNQNHEIRFEQIQAPVTSSSAGTTRANTVPLTGSLSGLPLLTDAVAARNNLPPLQLNMVKVPKPGSPTPFPSAVINLTRVMVGERIQNSKAILFQVEEDGVGIEIVGTEARYYLPLR